VLPSTLTAPRAAVLTDSCLSIQDKPEEETGDAQAVVQVCGRGSTLSNINPYASLCRNRITNDGSINEHRQLRHRLGIQPRNHALWGHHQHRGRSLPHATIPHRQ